MPEIPTTSGHLSFPDGGTSWDDLEPMMDALVSNDIDWRNGRTPLYVFYADDTVQEIGQRGFNKFFSENALGAKRAFFSLKEMESNLVEYGLDLLNAPNGASGITSTGGSESIIIGVKAARDFARSRRSSSQPFNIVAPYSAHPAFNKAGDLMDIEVRRSGMDDDCRASVAAMADLIDENTIMLVASAPCFPHGVVDPIDAIGDLAAVRDIWLHVDACVGGYILPFLKRLGRPLPNFDFGQGGVRSISADLHKFGFCPKPISTLFFRYSDDLERVTFKFDQWPNGLFSTSTLVGTRAGGAIAGAWAVVNYLGYAGYTAIAEKLADMTDKYVHGIEKIDGLHMISKPDATIINFGAHEFDIFRVAEILGEKGWLPGLTRDPKGMHAMMSLCHAPVREQYLSELEFAVEQVRRDKTGVSDLTATY